MFREIRLKDKAVDDKKTTEIIAKGSYGISSTIMRGTSKLASYGYFDLYSKTALTMLEYGIK